MANVAADNGLPGGIAMSYSGPNFPSSGGDTEYKMFGHRRGAPPKTPNLNESTGLSRPSCRKYHMESDIFGIGMNPAEVKLNKPQNPMLDPAYKANQLGAAGKATIIQNVDWFGDDPRQIATPSQPLKSPEEETEEEVDENKSVRSNTHSARSYDNDINSTCNNGNARENGCNPITGQGYKEASITQSKRRQFIQPAATKLW